MSLDVYLTMREAKRPHTRSGIFIREDGQQKEITRAEWDVRPPPVPRAINAQPRGTLYAQR